MKLAYVYDSVYPWEKGGAQKRIWEVARRLSGAHDVHCYGMHYWDGPTVMERDGITYHGVCPPQELYVNGRRSIPQAIRFATALTRPLMSERFDVIDCQQFPYFPVLTSRLHDALRRSSLVVTWYEVWGSYWRDYLGWKGVFGQRVERLTVKVAPYIVAISEFVEADLRSIGRTSNVSVVHNGVDYEGIRSVEAADESWDVVYVGRLAEHKHVDVLLEAVALSSRQRAEPVRCGIVGDGPDRDRLERAAVSLGVAEQVEFLGFLDEDDDVIATLKAAELFVLPSTREGFPNTILEANACGVPAIVIDHPENGSTAVVEDGETGFVVPLSAEAVAAAIADYLDDEGLQNDLADGARAFALEHDWAFVVEELLEVYESVSNGGVADGP